MIHQKRRKQQKLTMPEEEDEEMSVVRFQEPEETRHRQSNSNGRGRHRDHDQQHPDHHDWKQKKKSHHRRSSSSNSDTHERARRYIYSAISATFFFVLFREIGWIDQMQNALAESSLHQYLPSNKYKNNHRKNDNMHTINAGSVPSLASAAANMAATSMRLGNALDGVGITTHGSLTTTTTTGSTSMNGASGPMMNAAGQLLGNSKNFLSKKEMMDYVKLVDDTIVPNSRPIMYTFFEWIPPRSRGTSMSDIADKALITEWKAAWKAAGWHPIVLTLDDAKKHVDYEDYAPKLSKIPMLGVAGVGHGGGGTVVYNQLCFFRWLAVAAAGGGFMSDYDVFPISRAPEVKTPPPEDESATTTTAETTGSTTLQVLPENGNFTVYCRIQNSRTAGIPCLMSGRAEEWTRMAYALLENGIRNTNANDNNNNNAAESETMWSDMLALIDMRNENKYQVHDAVLEGHKVLLERDWTVADCDLTETKEAVHFSHEALKLGYLPPGETAENRPDIIRRFLSKWKELCGNQMEKKQTVLGISNE